MKKGITAADFPKRRISLKQEKQAQERNKINETKQCQLFDTLFGDEKTFNPNEQKPSIKTTYDVIIPDKIDHFELKYPKTCFVFEDDPEAQQIRESTAKSSKRLRIPQNKDISLLKNQFPPKLIIPKSRPQQTVNSARVNSKKIIHPIEPEKILTQRRTSDPDIYSPRSKTSQFPQSFSDPNERLYLFDNEEYDIDFLDKQIKLLQDGNILKGYSLFYASQDQTEWAPCQILSYDSPYFMIKFLNGYRKQVRRISLRFEEESIERFEKRRQEAENNRLNLDIQLKREQFILSHVSDNPINDPSLITQALQRLPKKMQNLPLIQPLLQDVREAYAYADAVYRYPDPSAEPKPIKDEPGLLTPNQINLILLPDIKPCYSLTKMFIDFQSIKSFEDTFQLIHSPIEFPHFLESLNFQLKTFALQANGQYYRKLHDLAFEIALSMPYERRASILQMIDFRYVSELSKHLVVILKNFSSSILQHNLKFIVVASESLNFVSPCKDDFLKMGINAIASIRDLFKTYPVLKVQEIDHADEPNIVATKDIDDALIYASDQWTSIVKDDFTDLDKLFKELISVTTDIPENPYVTIQDLLPPDCDAVLAGHEPCYPSDSIRFEAIGQTLTKCCDAYDYLTCYYRNIMEFRFLSVDLTSFFKNQEKRYSEFKNAILTYISYFGKHQVHQLFETISNLKKRTSAEPTNVNEWYEKKSLIAQVKLQFESMNQQLEFILTLNEFLTQFLFESEFNDAKIYSAKYELFKFKQSVEQYEKDVEDEKVKVQAIHEKEKEEFQDQLKVLFDRIINFHFEDVQKSLKEKGDELNSEFNLFNKYKKISRELIQKDHSLEIPITNYPLILEIEYNFSIFLPIWDISNQLSTTAEEWLSTSFLDLNVSVIIDTIQQWSLRLSQVTSKLEKVFSSSTTTFEKKNH